MEELKPCPFCGGENFRFAEYPSLGIKFQVYECMDCGSTTRAFKDEASRKDAIDLWNTRTEANNE